MVQRSSSVVLTSVVFALGLLSSIGDASAQSTLEFDRSRTAGSPIRTLNGFVENHGQWPDDVLFFARQGPIEATLRKDALVLRPQHDPESDEPRAAPVVIRLPQSAHLALEGEGLLPTKHHFLIGDSAGHRSNVPSYERIVYRGLAPGVDMVVRAEDTGFAYDLHLEPGAELGELALAFENVSAPHVRDDGVLVLDTASGPLEQHIGAAWEVDEAGERVEVQSMFRLLDAGAAGEFSLGFEAPTRRADRAYVLDPSLIFSTYLGAGSKDALREIDVAPDGSTYMIVETWTGMPVSPGAPDQTTELTEAWIGKLSPDGSSLEWATFLGGSDAEVVDGVHLDQDGTVVAVGQTFSGDFPTTPGSMQPANSAPGKPDAFIARLAADGSSLLWGTYFGGSGEEDVTATALLPNGDVLVAGFASAESPPATPSAYDTQWDELDMYLLRVSADGSTRVFQTFFIPAIATLALDADSNIYFGAGVSPSWEVIGTPGAFKEVPTPQSGDAEGVVVKMDPMGSEIRWATYLGGSGSDSVARIALDPSGAVYVLGNGASADFPVTAGAFDSSTPGVYVAKLLPNGTDLVWATFLTSEGAAQTMSDLAVDRAGNAVVTGSTNGPDFPTTPDAFQPQLFVAGSSGDATLTKLDAFGESLEYSTYFGAFGSDQSARVGFTEPHELRMGIFTTSSNLFVTPDAYDSSYGGSGDASVSAWDLGLLPWTVLGFGLKGSHDIPNLAGTGELTPGAPTRLSLRGAEPQALAHFVIGVQAINAPFKGGTFVPAPFRIFNLSTNATGGLDLSFPWFDVPAGIPLHIQVWMQDPGGVLGWSASNALQLVSQ